MLSAHQRNRAERAAVVASLADLEVAHGRRVAGIHAHPWMRCDGLADESLLAQSRHELVHLRRAEEEVDFGEHVGELVTMPLDHAPDGHHRGGGSIDLHASGFHDGVDRLALGRIDEAAGVHDDQLGGRGIGHQLGAVIDQLREIALRVDGVLVAAEGHNGNSHSGRQTADGRRQTETPVRRLNDNSRIGARRRRPACAGTRSRPAARRATARSRAPGRPEWRPAPS